MNKKEIELKHCELEYTEANQMLDTITQFAKIALQSLIMINGTAIISLLTFLGNTIENSKIYNSSHLRISISCFTAGLVAGCCATFCAYLAQQSFRCVYEAPHKYNWFQFWGSCYRWIASLSAIISLTLFCFGAYWGINGIIVNTHL